jgi:protein phosphatase PTC7
MLENSLTLIIDSLGDSGFAHFRLAVSPPSVVHVSPHQTHAFNTPWQLSQTPPSLRRKMELFGRSAPQGDQPKHAALSQHQLQHGDVVMYATDGVWDNLSEEELVAIIAEQCESAGIWQDSNKLSNKHLALSTSESTDSARSKQGRNLQVAIATAVVNAAKKAGLDDDRDGPFAKEVQKRYPHEEFHGGKHDDVAVIVLVALETSQMAQAKL